MTPRPSTRTWTTATDLRDRVLRWWESGRVLAEVVSPTGFFPRRVALRGPASAELGECFAQAREWVAAMNGLRHVTVETRTVRHRQLGSNTLPTAVVVASPHQAAAFLGKGTSYTTFESLLGVTRARRPEVLGVMARSPHVVLAAAQDWVRLLDVVDWVINHPRPGVYLRQVDLPGVHTKFVEGHQRLLAALLDAALPPDAIDATRSPNDFARRYGFRARPRLVRFRYLEGGSGILGALNDGDHTLTVADFAQLQAVRRVFVTENEVNFLAFPPAADAMVVFGAGSGLEHLATVPWLASAAVHYWGDIDTHGFAILDQLRAALPHATSLLMDHETLMSHERYWGREERQVTRDLPNLTEPETRVYDALRDNRIRPNLRLEQERVRFGVVRRIVARVAAG